MTFRQPVETRTCQLGSPHQALLYRVVSLTASPSSTSLTLLEGLGAFESAIANESDVAGLSRSVPEPICRWNM